MDTLYRCLVYRDIPDYETTSLIELNPLFMRHALVYWRVPLHQHSSKSIKSFQDLLPNMRKFMQLMSFERITDLHIRKNPWCLLDTVPHAG